MSLIHDALRKARRQSVDEESRGVVYSGGLTGRRRQPHVGLGILFGVLLGLAVAVAVAGAIWLRITTTGEEGSTASTGDPPLLEITSTPTPPSEASLEPTRGAIAFPTTEAETGPVPTPPPTPLARESSPPRVAEAPPEPTPRQRTDSAAAPATRPAAAPSQSTERVYVVEADLGYTTLTLDYIVFRSSDPFAQINGLDLRVGSTIEGFTVEEIGRSSVRLRDDRGPLILRVP